MIRGNGFDDVRNQIAHAEPDLQIEDVRFLPLITRPTTIYCAGRNYHDQVAEMRAGAVAPEFPTMFIKTMGSLVAHEDAVVKPKVSDCFDYEAELAIVIGTAGRHIAKTDALAHVAGYTCLMDGSIRDWQQRSTDQGKNFWRSSSFEPWLATRDEVPADRGAWKIQGRLNGTILQSSTIGQLIYGIEDLISYNSTTVELRAGDLISTGTCAGVGHGRKPPVYLRDGDVFEVEIDGVGVLRNRVVAET